MSNYSAEERETGINSTDADKKWRIYTLQQAVIGKLKRAGCVPTKVSEDGAYYYELDFNQVSFRSGKKREMSDEQKEKAANRMRSMHENKKLKGDKN